MSIHPRPFDIRPFPMIRPEISIQPVDAPLFEVDWRELAWWFVVPEVGECIRWAIYDSPDWRLSSCCEMHAERPAIIHGIAGVEISAEDFDMKEEGEIISRKIYARLTDDSVQYLATLSLPGETRELYTLRDEGFAQDWGDSQRRIRHSGRFEEDANGYHQCSGYSQDHNTLEALNVCKVVIGQRSFTCLHVIDLEHNFSAESILMEGYLTAEGRTVLCRRYNGRQWACNSPGDSTVKQAWDERLPGNERLVIDDVIFVHWYDCLSEMSFAR